MPSASTRGWIASVAQLSYVVAIATIQRAFSLPKMTVVLFAGNKITGN